MGRSNRPYNQGLQHQSYHGQRCSGHPRWSAFTWTHDLTILVFVFVLWPLGGNPGLLYIRSRGISVPSGPCGRPIVYPGLVWRPIVYPGLVWRAQVRMGSGLIGITVPSGSRVYTPKPWVHKKRAPTCVSRNILRSSRQAKYKSKTIQPLHLHDTKCFIDSVARFLTSTRGPACSTTLQMHSCNTTV